MSPEFEKLIREYADGKVSWALMKTKGVTNYLSVLAALGELNLKPPTAPADIQAPARAALRQILQAQAR